MQYTASKRALAAKLVALGAVASACVLWGCAAKDPPSTGATGRNPGGLTGGLPGSTATATPASASDTALTCWNMHCGFVPLLGASHCTHALRDGAVCPAM